MRTRRSVLLFAAIIMLSSSALGQLFRSTSKVGTTAAQFLKIGAGARAVAMGGAFAGTEGDLHSIYWNPAGLSRMATFGAATFSHAEWLADISYDFAALALNLGSFGTLGGSIVIFGTPEEDVRTIEFPEGDGRKWDATSLAIGLAYARNLTDRFSIGFSAKFISERIWNETANGIAIDVGTLYRTPFRGLRLGAAISNFGTKMRLDGRDIQFNFNPSGDPNIGPSNIPSQYRVEDYDIPLMFRIGLALDLVSTEAIRTTAAVDATHPNDNVEFVNSGLELAWREIFFARVGYKSLFLRDSEQGFTWGVGLHYDIVNGANIMIDYAFADYGRLNDVQFVSLSLEF